MTSISDRPCSLRSFLTVITGTTVADRPGLGEADGLRRGDDECDEALGCDDLDLPGMVVRRLVTGTVGLLEPDRPGELGTPAKPSTW